jgi:hypothetical protein
MLDLDGEVWDWGRFPTAPNEAVQKTFWWSANWQMQLEPRPTITVDGTRLDGPGTFRFDRGTNARLDGLGDAMLVGIDVPTPGCWEISATYRGATLSYVA